MKFNGTFGVLQDKYALNQSNADV